MKRASFRLAYRNAERITNIALDAGYDAPDAFGRAFRKQFGQSPSTFRTKPDWQQLLETFEPLDQARSRCTQLRFTIEDITIRETDPIPVAIMTHRGDPAMIGYRSAMKHREIFRCTVNVSPCSPMLRSIRPSPTCSCRSNKSAPHNGVSR
ncbi:Transcriptional regulator, AraC family [Granulibacter bethesdensis]|nr:Transcriptional regulator, AraC family [Granulibacter bethesdensis]